MKQTERGLYWIKVHVANLFDQDKLSFDERVKWVDDNMAMLQRINDDPYDNREWVSDKKKKTHRSNAWLLCLNCVEQIVCATSTSDGWCMQ